MSNPAIARAGGDPLSLIALLGLGLIWSGGLPFAKVASQHDVPALGYMAWVTTGGLILLGIACRLKGLSLGFDRASLVYYLLAGVFGHAVPQINIFVSTSHAPVSAVSIVITSTPILTYGFALAIGIERLSTARLVGVASGIAGALFILLPKSALPGPDVAFWVAVAFVTPFCYALSNVALVRWKPVGIHPMTSALGMLGTAAAVLWPTAIAFDQVYVPNLSAPTPGDIALLTQSLLVGFGYILFFFIIHRAGPVFLTMVSFVVLSLATLWGVLFFAERLTGWFAAAVACVVVGVVLIQRSSAAYKPPPTE